MTDIERYDRAIFEYLSTLSKKIVYAPTSKAIQTITKDKNYKDAIPYNFISFYRSPNFELDKLRDSFSAAQFGDMVRLQKFDDGSREARYVHNFPVNFTYQIDMWATKESEVQETSIALLHKIYTTRSVLDVKGINPDGEPGRFHFTEILWTDNSDLEVENEKGRLYRHTVTVTIDARIKLARDVPTTEFCAVPVDIYNNEGE